MIICERIDTPSSPHINEPSKTKARMNSNPHVHPNLDDHLNVNSFVHDSILKANKNIGKDISTDQGTKPFITNLQENYAQNLSCQSEIELATKLEEEGLFSPRGVFVEINISISGSLFFVICKHIIFNKIRNEIHHIFIIQLLDGTILTIKGSISLLSPLKSSIIDYNNASFCNTIVTIKDTENLFSKAVQVLSEDVVQKNETKNDKIFDIISQQDISLIQNFENIKFMDWDILKGLKVSDNFYQNGELMRNDPGDKKNLKVSHFINNNYRYIIIKGI